MEEKRNWFKENENAIEKNLSTGEKSEKEEIDTKGEKEKKKRGRERGGRCKQYMQGIAKVLSGEKNNE